MHINNTNSFSKKNTFYEKHVDNIIMQCYIYYDRHSTIDIATPIVPTTHVV